MLPDDPHDTAPVERLLYASRPVPDEEFVVRTEDRLLGRAQRRRARSRSLAAALGLSGALAAAALGAMLVDAGPLGGKDDKATAKPDCRYVTVTTVQRRGELVRTTSGETKVVQRARRVPHTVRRCDR